MVAQHHHTDGKQQFDANQFSGPMISMKDFSGRLSNFTSSVSVIGANRAFGMSSFSLGAIIWKLLLLFSLALAVYQIQDRIVYYISYPTATDVRIVQPPRSRYPQITICNENFLRKSAAISLGIYNDLVKQQQLSPNEVKEANFTNLNKNAHTQAEWDAIWKQCTQPVSEGVVQLFWQGNPIDLSELTHIETSAGGCFTFNTRYQNYYTSVPSEQNGLKLMLYMNEDDYLNVNSPAVGFRILVHDQYAFPLMYEMGYYVGPGLYTSIAVQMEKSTQYPHPYSNCIDTFGYRSATCTQDCQALYIKDRCGCHPPSADNTTRYCTVPEMFTCVIPAFVDYLQTAGAETDDAEPLCPCPPECIRTDYRITVSQARASDIYLRDVYNVFNITKDEWMRNYATVNIFFSTLAYHHTNINPAYDIMGLLSDVGGALGLLLGATLLTFYEICEFGIVMIFDYVRYQIIKWYRKEKGNKNQQGSSLPEKKP